MVRFRCSAGQVPRAKRSTSTWSYSPCSALKRAGSEKCGCWFTSSREAQQANGLVVHQDQVQVFIEHADPQGRLSARPSSSVFIGQVPSRCCSR